MMHAEIIGRIEVPPTVRMHRFYREALANTRMLHRQRLAGAAGLPVHGASMPLALAMFLVQYLSRPGDLVVDPFGGAVTTGKACEELGRLWMSSELIAEYLMCGRLRFAQQSNG